MRILLPSIAIVALVGGVSLALAAEASGTIKTLDVATHTVTLSNGSSYMAPKTVDLAKFKVGEKVSVNYTKSNNKMDITSMKAAS